MAQLKYLKHHANDVGGTFDACAGCAYTGGVLVLASMPMDAVKRETRSRSPANVCCPRNGQQASQILRQAVFIHHCAQAREGKTVRLVSPDTGQDRWKRVRTFLFNAAHGEVGCLHLLKILMKSSLTPRAILAATLAAAFVPSVHSQTTLSPVIVTAARMPQAAKDVLSDTLVITAEELMQSGQRTLVDVLQQKRGFEISRNGGPGSVSTVLIRGAANYQSIVLVDGVRIGSATLGGATWETIPLAQIERVEVVYGPLGSLYGADAIGGVVQIFTKQGDGAPSLNASAGAGSFGTRAYDVGISGAVSGEHKVRYAVQAARETSDGFSASTPQSSPYTYNPDKDGYTKSSASARFSIDLAKGHELGLNLMTSRLDAQFDAGAGFDDHNEMQLATYALYSKNKLAQNWTSFVQIAQSLDKGKTFASYGNSVIDTTQNQATWQNDFAFGADVLQVVLERRNEKVDSDTPELARERSTNSLATSYRLRRGSHLGSASLRADKNSQFGTHTTGSIEYGYRISNAWRVNASTGTSFRAPSFNELYYPYFGIASNKPEKSENFEAGLYFDKDDLQFSAVAYRNRLSDLLVYAPTCPVEQATHPYGCAYNIDKATLSGLSLSAAEKFGSISVRGALDLQDPRDDTTGKRLPRRARQHGSLGIDYAVGTFKLGAETVFSSARFDNGANTVRLAGYNLLNLTASTALAKDWTAFGRWNNVTDKNYDLSSGYATAGANLFVGLRYAMK